MKVVVPIPRPRNEMARALRDPRYKKRVVPNKKKSALAGRAKHRHRFDYSDGGHS